VAGGDVVGGGAGVVGSVVGGGDGTVGAGVTTVGDGSLPGGSVVRGLVVPVIGATVVRAPVAVDGPLGKSGCVGAGLVAGGDWSETDAFTDVELATSTADVTTVGEPIWAALVAIDLAVVVVLVVRLSAT
jgi:hypothetical protein